MKRILTLALMLGLVAGCASVGRKLDQSAVDRIKKGETTRDEVLKSLGSPDQIIRMGNGDVTFQYMYIRATARPESYIPVVGAFAGGANVQNQMLTVTFGPDGIVKDIISTYGATESGFGASAGSKADLKDVETNKRPK
jgi:outer membrane protein assembly factor BamE (lipoprotein component of BamABCDE complex)